MTAPGLSKYSKMSNCDVFFLDLAILSDLSHLVYLDYSTVVPKREKSFTRYQLETT